MASLPLRVRIRPHAPLPTQPFLLPVLPASPSGGSSQASSSSNSSSSIETVADLARHLVSKLKVEQDEGSALEDCIALYLDGFRLIDWHYRVHDVLREADVLE